jgi:hypothetical protein
MNIIDELFKAAANTPLPQFEQQPPITMTFAAFLKGRYDQTGRHNLYIVWNRKQALYVGIAKDDIRSRWFGRGGQGHMYFSQINSAWVGITPIGTVIQRNFPKSLKWKIELQRYNTFSWCYQHEMLDRAERRLIHELRPLFNTSHRPRFTDKENELIRKLNHANF